MDKWRHRRLAFKAALMCEAEVGFSDLNECGNISYPEGAVGDVDFSPGDDDGVFDGFCGDVNTEVGAVSVICDLYVDGETVGVLRAQTQNSHIPITVKDKLTPCF